MADLKIDSVDLKILELLSKDARASFRDIAKALRVSASTVFLRVRKMEESGVLRGFAPLIDLEKLGYGITVSISVKVRGGKLEEVEKELSELPEVVAVYDITGEWDALVIAKFRSMRELNYFVKKLLSNPRIEHTYTSTVLNTLKEKLFASPNFFEKTR
jgi:Lrp/AsnC family transcriptional regulator for asnA, asnC and gidA